jgi:hypothetical protein
MPLPDACKCICRQEEETNSSYHTCWAHWKAPRQGTTRLLSNASALISVNFGGGHGKDELMLYTCMKNVIHRSIWDLVIDSLVYKRWSSMITKGLEYEKMTRMGQFDAVLYQNLHRAQWFHSVESLLHWLGVGTVHADGMHLSWTLILDNFPCQLV